MRSVASGTFVLLSGVGITAHEAAAYLAYGDGAALFWGGLIVIGIAGAVLCNAIVIAATFSERLAKVLPGFAIAACACTIIGGFILRWLVLAGGLHPQVLVPGQYQIMGGSMFDAITFLHQ